jgi:hypothetical protein
MLLDAVLDEPGWMWLGPARDKRRHFIRHLESRLDAREDPHLTFGDGPREDRAVQQLGVDAIASVSASAAVIAHATN